MRALDAAQPSLEYVADAFGHGLCRWTPHLQEHERRHHRGADEEGPAGGRADAEQQAAHTAGEHPRTDHCCLHLFVVHDRHCTDAQRLALFRTAQSSPSGQQAWGPGHTITRGNGATCGDRSVVQDDTEERAVHLEPAVVFDQAELAELVHEEVHPRARRAHHFGKRLL
jgi:hypothetical protein